MEIDDRTPDEPLPLPGRDLRPRLWTDRFGFASGGRTGGGWPPYLIGAIVVVLWVNALRLLL